MGRCAVAGAWLFLAGCTASATGHGPDAGLSGDASAASPRMDGATQPTTGAGGSRSDASRTDASSTDAGPETSTCTGRGSLTSIWPLDPALAISSMAIDARGDVYLAGSLTGTATLGTTKLTATGSVDLFLAKLDSTGRALSAAHWGDGVSYQNDSPVVAVDTTGDVYVAGFFTATLDFGGTTRPITAISVDAFVVKFDASGQAVWSDRFGYDQGPYAILSMALAANGDPIVAGTAGGTIVIGDETWTAPDPPGSGNEQGFVARVSAKDGSVVWSNASGGNTDLDHVVVATDSLGRAFLAARVLSGGSAWGKLPVEDGGDGLMLRVGFDPSGSPKWSRFDEGALPMAEVVDTYGRVAVFGSGLFDDVVVGTTSFPSDLSMAALLLNPSDGTLLSGTTIPESLPQAAAASANGYTFVAGQYSRKTATFGNVVLPSPGVQNDGNLFVAELDPAAHSVWADAVGSGSADAQGMAIGPDGHVLVAGTTRTAFTTSAGSVPVGPFVAAFTPPTCANDPGSAIPPGDGSRGALADAAAPMSNPSPAMCPAKQADATNGAACPMDMGCSYGTTCCFCAPRPCNGKPTLWTCDPLPTPDSACPATPPSPGTSCPPSLSCNYCLPGGRYFANCTGGGWEVGYAQIVCN